MRAIRTANSARAPEGAFRRFSSLAGLCLSISLSACFGHSTADEEVVEVAPNIRFDADAGGGAGAKDAGKDSAVAANDCSKQTDPVLGLLCTLGGSGDLTELVTGLLGGGMKQDCSKQTDPFANLICMITSTGGGGIEGLLGGLLGGGGAAGGLGGLLGDGGIEGVISSALADVIGGIIDDLIAGLLGGNGETGGLFGGLFGGGGNRMTGNKSLDLFRTSEECSSVSPDDLLTRLVCARQLLATIPRSDDATP